MRFFCFIMDPRMWSPVTSITSTVSIMPEVGSGVSHRTFMSLS